MKFLPLLCLALLFFACSKTTVQKLVSHEADTPEVGDESKLPAQLAPPGAAGPFIAQLDSKFPSRVFATAANISHFSVAYQSDVGDITQCTETQINVCFKGYLSIVTRTNPAKIKTVEIYESDTQSGAQIIDLLATQNGFAILYNNGRYIGDETQNHLLFMNNNGEPTLNVPLELEQQGALVAAANMLPDDNIILCSAHNRSISSSVTCQKVYASGKMSKIVEISSPSPLRQLAVISSKERQLLAYLNADGLQLVFLDDTTNTTKLGFATTHKPQLAYGHGAFLLLWQDDKAQLNAVRIEDDGQQSKTLTLAGLQYHVAQGLAAVPQGFLFAVNAGKVSEIGLLNPRANSWYLLDNSNAVRLISVISSLDIQNARLGRFVWQSAASLIGMR
ncbi:MAG: hypothetical protein WC966_00810 [Bradymonadales bacterium]